MKMTASRTDVGVGNLTTRTPSLVVVESTTVKLFGIGRSKGMLRSALVVLAVVGDAEGAADGHVGVGTGCGLAPAAGASLPPHPARVMVAAMTRGPNTATRFTP